MHLNETKQLLRTYRITPNKLMGQNFLVEASFYTKLSEYATLSKSDIVLDVGAGFGFLTRFLAGKCKAVVGIEKDPRLAFVLRRQVQDLENVTLLEGDVLKVALPQFNKVAAVPPYYLSSRLIAWLLNRKIDCAMLLLQKEFANKLVATVGSEDYGWLAVLVSRKAEVKLLDEVPKTMFFPQPEVDSVIVQLTPLAKAPFNVQDEAFFNRLVRWLFTQRNKKLRNALVPFLKNEHQMGKEEAVKLASANTFAARRPRDLSPKDFGELANALQK